MNYVVGFLFSLDILAKDTKVALIEKQKPEWQKNRFNGIGGKVEDGENPLEAMTREFKEETGALIIDWRPFCEYFWRGDIIYFFESHGDLSKLESKEIEQIKIVKVCEVGNYPIIINLRWLIPLALDHDNVTATIIDPS